MRPLRLPQRLQHFNQDSDAVYENLCLLVSLIHKQRESSNCWMTPKKYRDNPMLMFDYRIFTLQQLHL